MVAAQFIRSPAQAAADARPPLSRITVAVERRVLRDTLVLRGTVVPGRAIQVAPTGTRDGGRLILTGLRVRAHDTVKAGQVLAEVSGRPVIALPGGIPTYRDLRPGAQGRDVAQLQAALRALGYRTGLDRRGFFGAGTKQAVAGLYDALGYQAARTGDDDDRRIADARLQVRRAERALAAAKAEQASSGQGRPAIGVDAVADAQDALDQARQDLADLERSTGPMLPMDEVVFVPAFPARVDRVSATLGSPIQGALLVLSAGELVVQAELPPSDRGLVRPGQRVGIVSEATGLSARGAVAAIGEYGAGWGDTVDGGDGTGGGGNVGGAGGSPGGAAAQGYPLTVRGTAGLDSRLAGQDVRITIEAASTHTPVLVVPLAAVSTRADGQAQVVRVGAQGQEARVMVRAGTSGDGYVGVTPLSGALAAGDKVVVGR
jgi:hypothetical protein